MKLVARIIYYSLAFVCLTLAFSYLHLDTLFIREIMSNGLASPAGDKIYAWQNHGTVYLDHTDAVIANNLFLAWIVLLVIIGVFLGIVAQILGIRMRPRGARRT